MAALTIAEEILDETEKTLAAAIAKLREAEEGIEKLQDQLREKEEKKADLERQKQLCEERIARAIKLIVGLSDEQKRWIIMVDDIKVSLKNAVGDILLSSGAEKIFQSCSPCSNYLLLFMYEKNKTINHLFDFKNNFLINPLHY